MISVDKAEKLVLEQTRDFGIEAVSIEEALGRVLAERVVADRDYPSGNRSTMDGVAIKFNDFLKGRRKFRIVGVQPAGQKPIAISGPGECAQIMTGAILDKSVDTIVKIEDVEIKNGYANIKTNDVSLGQFVHKKGSDKKKKNLVIEPGKILGAKEIAVLASLGYSKVKVRKLPKIIIITTGDELVDVEEKAQDYQTRRSNDRAISSVLAKFSIFAYRIHLPDNKQQIKDYISKSFQDYDVILLSGGVSKGDFDYVQTALEELNVEKIFHGVAQRPGKPFWFGAHGQKLIFAFPGNPVSAFLCLHRYFVPWLDKSLESNMNIASIAMLNGKIGTAELTQFIPAKLCEKEAKLFVEPIQNNGSGDFISLVEADAFLEIPAGKKTREGLIYKIWHII